MSGPATTCVARDVPGGADIDRTVMPEAPAAQAGQQAEDMTAVGTVAEGAAAESAAAEGAVAGGAAACGLSDGEEMEARGAGPAGASRSPRVDVQYRSKKTSRFWISALVF